MDELTPQQEQLLRQAYGAKQWDERLDECRKPVLHWLAKHRHEEALGWVLGQGQATERDVLFYLPNLSFVTLKENVYSLSKIVLSNNEQGSGEKWANVLRENLQPYGGDAFGDFLRILAQQACEHDDIVVCGFVLECTKKGLGPPVGYILEPAFVYKAHNILSCLKEYLQTQDDDALNLPQLKRMVMGILWKQSVDGQSLELAFSWMRDELALQGKDDSFLWEDTKFNDSLLESAFRQSSSQIWQALKKMGFLGCLPHTFGGIGSFANRYASVIQSADGGVCREILSDIFCAWKNQGVEWKTAFLGGVSEEPKALNAVLKIDDDLVLDAYRVLGEYYIRCHYTDVPSLWQYYEKIYLTREVLPNGVEHKSNAPGKKM